MAVGLQPATAGLTDIQAKFLAAYVSGQSVSDAALSAGAKHGTYGYEILRVPKVQAALRDFQARVIETEGAPKAYRTMIALLDPPTPAGTRFAAAKYLLDAAGYGAPAEEGDKKDVNAMTPDELAAAIHKFDQALASHADAAIPVKTQVIEHNPPSGG